MTEILPKRCSLCQARSKNLPLHDCQICMDQGITESFLCDLLREGADLTSFDCHSFRPYLTLVGKKEKSSGSLSVCQDKKGYFNDVVQMISSGRCAGGGCGGGQCGSDNKKIPGSKKYHVVWSIHQRNPLFAKSERYVSYLHDVLLSCGRLLKGKVLLLWLAPDHLHLYVEFAGSDPIEEVVDDLQELVHDALTEEFHEFANVGSMIWEKDFFLEEI